MTRLREPISDQRSTQFLDPRSKVSATLCYGWLVRSTCVLPALAQGPRAERALLQAASG